jgi:hypothetical protein
MREDKEENTKAMAILSSSMKCSLRSTQSSVIYGVLWIRKVRLSMCFFSEDVM